MRDLKFPLGAINRNSYDGSAHAFNIRLKDGALRPVDKPSETPIPFGVEYIHAAQDYKNLIGYSSRLGRVTVTWLGSLPFSDFQPRIIGYFDAEVYEIKHIGNTLIFLTSDGSHYFLFKNGEYSHLGNKIPMPRLQFGCTDFDGTIADDAAQDYKNRVYASTYFANCDESAIKYDQFGKAWAGEEIYIQEQRQAVTDDFSAAYNKSLSEIIEMGVLPDYPIQLRYALRLYDGSYIYHSAPILVSQSSGLNSFVYCPKNFSDAIDKIFLAPKTPTLEDFLRNGWTKYPPVPRSLIDAVPEADNWLSSKRIRPLREALSLIAAAAVPDRISKSSRLAIKIKSLMFRLLSDNNDSLEQWSDIIDSIDIFISKQVTPVKIGELALFPNDDNLQVWHGFYEYDGSLSQVALTACATEYLSYAPYTNLPRLSQSEIHDAVAANGNFFLLKSIKIHDGEYKQPQYQNRWVNLANEIHDHYASIETRKALPDDFSSHHSMTAKTAYIYNQALHLGNISSKLFHGFSPFDFCVYAGDKGDYSDEGVVKTSIDGSERLEAVAVNPTPSEGTFFISPMIFYPDTEASRFELTVARVAGNYAYGSFAAKPHEMLTGAYFLSEDLSPLALSEVNYLVTLPQDSSPTRNEPNKVMASAVSNPYVFNASQTNYVGNASVLALCAATTALSQGQFGQFPLYVFCSDGVYALSMSNQGVYSSVAPISFDIILSKKLLAPTENAIIFATSQGVKILKGSSSVLVSDPLNGPSHNYSPGKPYHNPRLADILASICDADFPDFNDFISREGVELHFDYPDNEAWIARPDDTYAYIYNLDSKSWSYRTFSADKFIPQYPHLYLRIQNRLLDVTSRNDEKLPMAIITNPIPTQVFSQYADMLIDCNLNARQFRCWLLAGNNPLRLPLVKSKGFDGSTTKPLSGVHLSRIPFSARFIQLAITTRADDAALYSVSANVNPQPYNDKK